MNRMMKGLGLVLMAAVCAGAWAQVENIVPAEKPVVKTFYLSSTTQFSQGVDIVSALRNLVDPKPTPSIMLTYSQNAITVRGTRTQVEEVKQILSEIDRPSKTYRLTYTVEEQDGGKRVGVQHFAIVVSTGAKTSLKQGSRVPISTGIYDTDSKTHQTQFTYLDVGLNVEATLDEFAEGVRLKSIVEQSSLTAERSGMGDGNPIVRQTKLEGTALLTVGKTVALGSLDVPGSTRHLEVSVVAEPVK